MDSNIKTWLFDMLQSIQELESYFSEENNSLEFYLSDIKTKRAVERNLEIIGEVTNRISKYDKTFELENT